MDCHARVFVSCSALMLACGGQAVPEPAPPVMTAVPQPSAAAVVDAAPRLPAEPTGIASVAAPDKTVCSFSGELAGESYALRPSPGGPVLGTLSAGKAAAKLMGNAGLYVEATTGTLTLKGYVDPTPVLHATHAIKLGDLLTVTNDLGLVVSVAADGTLAASGPTIDGLTFVGHAPSVVVGCGDLGIARAPFDARAALPQAKASGAPWVLPQAVVPFAATPGGPVGLRYRSAGEGVDVLETRGGMKRIVVGSDGMLLAGWVPSASLHLISAKDLEQELSVMQLQMLSSLGGTSATTKQPTAIDELVCKTEVRIVAEANGARFLAGTLAPSSAVRVTARGDTLTTVSLPAATRDGFEPSAVLYAPTRDLAGCTSRPVTTDPPPPSAIESVLRSGPTPDLLNVPTNPPNPLLLRGDAGAAPPPGITGAVAVGAVAGSAPPDSDRVLATMRAGARACYNRQLAVDPTTKGKIVVQLKVDPSGEVSSASVVQSDLPPNLQQCVARRLQNAQFNPGTGWTFHVPMTFSLP